MIAEYAGRTALIAFAIYVMFFDGLRVVLGTLYHLIGG
jgi:hypothetical protein